MGKTAYKIKNMFKSPEQREIEARMEFNRNKRGFEKYYRELDQSIREFSQKAKEAELTGNHTNAVSCAVFVGKLQKTQTKVQGLLQRFEMMHSMQRLTGVMSKFVKACADMGYNMDSAIDLKAMWKNTAEMDMALEKMDAMSEQMDMIFDTIDSGMSQGSGTTLTPEESEAEAEALLDQIMGRHNAITYGRAETPAGLKETQEAAEPEDDTDLRLQKLMEELNG